MDRPIERRRRRGDIGAWPCPMVSAAGSIWTATCGGTGADESGDVLTRLDAEESSLLGRTTLDRWGHLVGSEPGLSMIRPADDGGSDVIVPIDVATGEPAGSGYVLPCRMRGVVTNELVGLAGQIRVRIDELDRRIAEALDLHPDGEIFRSLPRAGVNRAALLLAEIGDCRGRFPDESSLAAAPGVAPSTRASGKRRAVSFRRGCDKQLRAALIDFAQDSVQASPWARDIYDREVLSARSAAEGLSSSSATTCGQPRSPSASRALERPQDQHLEPTQSSTASGSYSRGRRIHAGEGRPSGYDRVHQEVVPHSNCVLNDRGGARIGPSRSGLWARPRHHPIALRRRGRRRRQPDRRDAGLGGERRPDLGLDPARCGAGATDDR